LNAENALPPMISASMAHLNLAMIHPFSDGNGRMSRCLQTLVLAREGILEPQFCSIEEYLGRSTQDYYEVLAKVGMGSWHPRNDARPWIQFCLTAHYRQARRNVRRIQESKLVWDELEELIKRMGLQERHIFALADATFGYTIRNSSYRNGADVSENLASRDLKSLVDTGLLVADGERRGRHYVASPILADIRKRNRQPIQNDNPFDSMPEQTLLSGLF
jgi:Fic family protein